MDIRTSLTFADTLQRLREDVINKIGELLPDGESVELKTRIQIPSIDHNEPEVITEVFGEFIVTDWFTQTGTMKLTELDTDLLVAVLKGVEVEQART